MAAIIFRIPLTIQEVIPDLIYRFILYVGAS